MKQFGIIILFLFLPNILMAQTVSMSGYVREAGSQENLIGCSVLSGKTLTTSNNYGFFALQIPANKPVEVVFLMMGYQKVTQIIRAKQDTTFEVFLTPQIQQLQEVRVVAQNPEQAPQMSVVRLPVAQIKQMPSLLGEKDVIKALQFLPGVQRSTEGSTALYVRGGSSDQNLILLDGAQVYNANHLFGFFSVFNGDAIKNVEFWKGGFPARYGGRLSSVIDLQMKVGGKDRVRGEGGVGLLSSRLTLDGPLSKSGKSSFLVSGRRTYIDLLLSPFMPKNESQSYRFYDFNAKVNVDLGTKDKLYLSGYFGNDAIKLKLESERTSGNIYEKGLLGWGNATGTLRWNHLFNQKLFLNTTFAITDFKFLLSDEFRRIRSDTAITNRLTEFSSSIRDYTLKADFDYFPNNSHSIKFGALLTNHRFVPRTFLNDNRVNNEQESDKQVFNNQEFALYGEDTYRLNRLSLNAGIRFNGLFSSNKTYLFLEPRLTANYQLPKNWFLKASYARNNQFVHLLTNTGTGLSTDLWIPATNRIPPQQADQIAIGLTKTFPDAGLNLTLESYRKWMKNIVAYKEGAAFLVFADGAKPLYWENNVTSGRGWSYGTEVLLQKPDGRLTGWLSYTLSWTINQFNELNEGKRFFARYDRRHDFSLVASYKLSPKITLSANWVYATGNALTVPQGFYFGSQSLEGINFDSPNSKIDYLGSRNSYRAEPYHRLDIAIQFHKKKRWGERTWEIGFYNAYSRKNPLYYYLKTEGERTILGKRALFSIIPSVTYNFKF